jgi:hypothetical protein
MPGASTIFEASVKLEDILVLYLILTDKYKISLQFKKNYYYLTAKFYIFNCQSIKLCSAFSFKNS